MKSLISILIFAAFTHWASGFLTEWCSFSRESGWSCTNLSTGKTVHFKGDPSQWFGMLTTTPSPWMLAHPSELML
uniref:Secreted protein n=1 Tax=Haemonchus contortus TaxID=6289 RepID=A0A7I4YJW9_HAECO